MKSFAKSLVLSAAMLMCLAAGAQEKPENDFSGAPWQNPQNGVQVENSSIGSGTPAPGLPNGTSTATPVADGLYHTPSYMPGFPTSARIDPRVVAVQCAKVNGGTVVCNGYNVNTMVTGRGEYLMIQPVIVPGPVAVTVLPPKTVLPVERKRVKE